MPENPKILEAYASLTFQNETGYASYFMTTTYKPYFDAMHCLDDGSSDGMFPGDPYSEIERRLESVGIFPAMESVFEFDPAIIGGKQEQDAAERLVAARAGSAGVTLLFGDTPFSRLLQEEGGY